MKGLINLLGEENVTELKKKIAEAIVDQVRYDMESYGEYLIYPPDMQDMVKEAMESTDKKVAKMYKDAVIEINRDYIDKMKNYMKQKVNDKLLRSKIIDYARHLSFIGNEFSVEHKISEELYKILRETESVECDS